MSNPLPTRCFVDTNIWFYAFVQDSGTDRTDIARRLIQEWQDRIAVSSQVISELAVNLIRRVQMPEPSTRALIRSFYHRFSVITLEEPLMLRASEYRERYSLSFWDSTVLAAAMEAGAAVLYTEDMQAGLQVEGLMIVNPFSPAASRT